MPPGYSAKFIVFEGGDESGKTTHAQLVSTKYGAVFTREPFGSKSENLLDIRQVLLRTSKKQASKQQTGQPSAGQPTFGEALSRHAEVLLFATDRALHVHNVIRPNLEAGKHVICDRYIGSSLAYQSFGRGFNTKTIWDISVFAAENLLPDLVLLLDIPIEEYFRRRQTSSKRTTRFDEESKNFHNKVRDGYLLLAEDNPQWVVIDSTRPKAEVEAHIESVLKERFQW